MDSSVSELSDLDCSPVRTTERVKDFFVSCDKCTKRTYASKRTEYTNVRDHALRCYGKEEVFDAIKTLRKQLQEGLDKTQAKKVQQNIVDGLGHANAQDLSFLSLIELVTLHDLPQTKLKDPS